MAKEPGRVRRADRKNITSGIAHVNSTFNNTMITIADIQGNTIAWCSAGAMGFKGSRKSTPYAAQVAAEEVARKAQDHRHANLGNQCKWPRLWPRKCCTCFASCWFDHYNHSRRNAYSAQWLSST